MEPHFQASQAVHVVDDIISWLHIFWPRNILWAFVVPKMILLYTAEVWSAQPYSSNFGCIKQFIASCVDGVDFDFFKCVILLEAKLRVFSWTKVSLRGQRLPISNYFCWHNKGNFSLDVETWNERCKVQIWIPRGAQYLCKFLPLSLFCIYSHFENFTNYRQYTKVK